MFPFFNITGKVVDTLRSHMLRLHKQFVIDPHHVLARQLISLQRC